MGSFICFLGGFRVCLWNSCVPVPINMSYCPMPTCSITLFDFVMSNDCFDGVVVEILTED